MFWCQDVWAFFLLVLSHIQPDIVTSYMQWSAKHTIAIGVISECFGAGVSGHSSWPVLSHIHNLEQ